MAKVKFKEGTAAEYNNSSPDEHTFYKVTNGSDSDNDEVYLGTVKIDNQITETNPSNNTSYYIPFVTEMSSATHYTTGGNNGLRYTTLGGTTTIQGAGTLELGNSLPSGTSGNKTGSIKLYGATGDYYEISPPFSGPQETMPVELPTFTSSTTGGTGWLVGMAGGGNKGTASIPVYVDQYGIVNACDATVGTASMPVYMSSGRITACSTTLSASITGNASTASKLGTATVGGTSTPIYLSAGTATACTSTVGGAATPIYMSSGTMRACTSTVGGTSTPVYMSGGTISACTATVGTTSVPVFMSAGRFYSCSNLNTGTTLSGTVGNVSTPVYLSNGDITTLTSTVGNGSHPAFMDAGTITACSSTVGTTSVPVFMSNGTFYSCSALGNRFVDWDTFNKFTTYGTYGPYAVSENQYAGASWTAINENTINGALCTYIENRGFMNCSNLTTVSFPICTWLESEAFMNCSQLSNVYFPKCSGMGYAAFWGCTSLTSVEFPTCQWVGLSGGTMKYSGYAFAECTALTTASFPAAEYFGEGTFASDTALKSLYLAGSSVAEADGDLFHSASFSGKIYVPSSLYSTYRTAANWSEYAACFVSM